MAEFASKHILNMLRRVQGVQYVEGYIYSSSDTGTQQRHKYAVCSSFDLPRSISSFDSSCALTVVVASLFETNVGKVPSMNKHQVTSRGCGLS